MDNSPAPADNAQVHLVLAWLPAWARAVVAIACVLLGAVLTVRPFSSAGVLVTLAGAVAVVTGVLALVSEDGGPAAYRWLTGAGWIILGAVVLAWPGLSVKALAAVVGVALIVTGATGIARAVARRSAEPAAELIGGVAGTVFGALALSWPDVTVLVVAVLFGARTVLFGLSALIALFTRRPAGAAAGEAAGRPTTGARRGLRIAGRSVALVAALGLLALSAGLRSRAAGPVSSFYTTPASLPAHGTLLDSEPFTRAVPGNARAWLILYSTKTSAGSPAAGSAIVLAPRDLPSGPRPVVLWTHGTVGIARPCAPSVFADPFAGVPAIPELLAHGWVMVMPDYVGTGTIGPTPYLIGTGQAYSSLDAALAAHHLAGLPLSEQTVIWGHSQGGHAALWAGELAASYAGALKIDGVAALAPATDLLALAAAVEGRTLGNVLAAYLLTAYANTYPDVRLGAYVRPGARAAFAAAAGRCVVDPGLVASVVISSTQPGGVFSAAPGSGPLGARLRENTPTASIGMPLLVAQGSSDEVIPIGITRAWVARQCAAGRRLDFRAYPELTHMGLLEARSPLTGELAAWTADRFAGKPAALTC